MIDCWNELDEDEEEIARWAIADLNWLIRRGPPPQHPVTTHHQAQEIAFPIDIHFKDKASIPYIKKYRLSLLS
jgi:hypothetical protein